MNINSERLWNHLQELSNIGRQEDGSITRFPFTEEDQEAQLLIQTWMEEAGLQCQIDAVGNVIGILEGTQRELPPVVCGSHFDSVKCGGAFDGCLGVLAGIEVLQSIKEQQMMLPRTLMVIGFKDEEGNRFGYGMIGSKAICGLVDPIGFASKDEQGISLYQAMQDAGYHPDEVTTCKLQEVHTFLELHIEQARVLEERGCSVGIVTGIAGLARYTITIKGESAHAGATPMHQRQDPVVAMSKWILHITALASERSGCVATIGQIQTIPGACNIICDHTTFSLDIRSLQESDIEDVMQAMIQYGIQLEKEIGVSIKLVKEEQLPPATCDSQIQQQMRRCCEIRKIPYSSLVSGAGHDGMNFKDQCPMGMIFVRSLHGYSHRLEEFSTQADCTDGASILFDMMLRCAS